MPQPRALSAPWSLEVVRGRDVGRVFELRGGETVLGNGLDGDGGLDLRDQETSPTRRMAARQAVLEIRGSDLVIRDLESPGGTFVNRQRLLAGQARPLKPGDEIQLGGVQLRVAAASGPGASPPAPASATVAGRLPEPYAIEGGAACRTWDDFLSVAAQRWDDLRGELTSGRLAEYLRRIGRSDLLPTAVAGESADEPLDRWLGRLPTSRSSAPELDVHPDRLDVPASGGTTRHVLRIVNVGYRLLRSTARVEPSGTRWVRIAPPHDAGAILTIDQTALPIIVDLPDGPAGDLAAEVVIESNGGTRRIPVRTREPGRPPEFPGAVGIRPGPTAPDLFGPVAGILAGVRPSVRIAGGIVAAQAIRMLVLVSGLVAIGPDGVSRAEPRLPALAAVCAAIAAVAGLGTGWRAGRGPVDAAASGVAAGLVGVLTAAVLHAVVRTTEGPLGAWSSRPEAVVPLWAAIGAGLAGLTCLIWPFRRPSGEASR